MEVKPHRQGSVPAGYKQTEVGLIPEGWEVQTGEQIATLIGKGGSPRWQGFEYSNSGMLFVTSENVRDGYLDIDDPKYLPLAFHEKLKRTKLQKHDILINLVGASIGRSCRVTHELGEANVNQAVAVFRVREQINSAFIACYFQAPPTVDRILGMQVDAARPNISLGNLRRFLIPLPTKAEQEAIAEALSDADALIESLEQLLAKKRQLKQGAMQDLLTGKKRLPGFKEEWEVKRLGEVATLYQPVTISAKQLVESGFPVYGANGIVGYYDKTNHDTWQVTVTCRGSTCGTVNRTVDRCWITGNAMVLNCDHNESISKEFFFHLLSNQDLSVCITGTGQPQIVRAPLAAIEVSLPSTVAEQTAIAAILSDMDAEIAALEARLAKARQLKQGMMQELLTGRTRLV